MVLEYIFNGLPMYEFYKSIGGTAYHTARSFTTYPVFGEYYGAGKFYYEGKRLGLTAAGEMLRNTSLNMLNDELSLQSRMQKRNGYAGRTMLWGNPVLGDDWVTEALRQFLLKEEKTDRKKRYLKLITADTEELLERLGEK